MLYFFYKMILKHLTCEINKMYRQKIKNYIHTFDNYRHAKRHIFF